MIFEKLRCTREEERKKIGERKRGRETEGEVA